MDIEFEWNNIKAETNIVKHRISFEEARTVFSDEKAILFDDPDHSGEEDRFLLLGISASARLLIVCHCYREDANTIRIISARKATRKESKQYEEFNS